MFELNRTAFFICTILLIVVLYHMIYNDNIDPYNHDTHIAFHDDKLPQSSNDITDVNIHPSNQTEVDIYMHPSNENPVDPTQIHEEQMMELVSQVREKCDLCADNMCTIECQKSRAVCEKLMGYGYYPEKIPCPIGGSLPGVPTPFNIYNINENNSLYETVLSPLQGQPHPQEQQEEPSTQQQQYSQSEQYSQ